MLLQSPVLPIMEHCASFWLISQISQKMKEKVTDDIPMLNYFRFLALLAFKIFSAEQVDVAIMEVGLGGKYDATNVDFLTGPSGKRKRDDVPPQYQAGGYIPQQDGAGDASPEIFELEIVQSKTSGRKGITMW